MCPACLRPHDWAAIIMALCPRRYRIVAFQVRSEYPGLPPGSCQRRNPPGKSRKLLRTNSLKRRVLSRGRRSSFWSTVSPPSSGTNCSVPPSSSPSHLPSCVGESFGNSNTPLSEEKRIPLQDPSPGGPLGQNRSNRAVRPPELSPGDFPFYGWS